jgi:hypothetical protein
MHLLVGAAPNRAPAEGNHPELSKNDTTMGLASSTGEIGLFDGKRLFSLVIFHRTLRRMGDISQLGWLR